MTKKVLVDAEALKALLDAVDAKGNDALEIGIMHMNNWRNFRGGNNPLDSLRAALDQPAAGYCVEGENRCVCGGDLPRVRAGCGNWRTE
jgi:hypothetical protein